MSTVHKIKKKTGAEAPFNELHNDLDQFPFQAVFPYQDQVYPNSSPVFHYKSLAGGRSGRPMESINKISPVNKNLSSTIRDTPFSMARFFYVLHYELNSSLQR